MPASHGPPGRLTALDSLRGVFAMMIVLLHTPVDYHFMTSPLIRNSHIVVEFFFVLSGFVIALNYWQRLGNGADFRRFVILRTGRIWPLHAFILLLFLLVFLAQLVLLESGPLAAANRADYPDLWARVGSELLFLAAFSNSEVWYLNFPSWSINAEYWTYILFAVILLAARGRPWLVMLGIAASLAVSAAVLWDVLDPGFAAAWSHSLFRSILFFLLGALASRLWVSGRVPRGLGTTGAELAVVAATVMALIFLDRLPNFLAWLALLFPLTILVFAHDGGAVSRLLARPLFRRLGVLSYTLYISHLFFIRLSTIILKKVEEKTGIMLTTMVEIDGKPSSVLNFGSMWVMDLYLIGLLIGLVWVCGLLNRWIEVPGQRWFASLATRAAPAPARL